MSSSVDTRTLGAVVLAGGLARRMGGEDKGLVTLNGRPMVTWSVEAVQTVASATVINANRNLDRYSAYGVPVIKDILSDFQGPLAGLYSGCNYLNTDWVLMCPCDTPFIQSTLIDHLWKATLDTEHPVVVAHDGERLQSVFSIVLRTLAPSIKNFLERGERKIDRWYEEVGFARVDCSAYSAMFENINTPEQIALSESQVSK